ncbi:MAG TPA: VCBS repeat-containing protein, partial [bacterium]|nr:VCBS repeat-containing protein [bacterium]
MNRRRRFGRAARITIWTGGSIILGLALVAVAFAATAPRGPRMFTDVTTPEMANTARSSESACWGDVDGDGDEDLFVATDREGSSLWRNDGRGSFRDDAAPAGVAGIIQPMGCGFVDIDGDGDLDLYLTTRRLGDEPGTQEAARRRGRPQTVNRLLKNRGDGTFEDATVSARVSAIETSSDSTDWADFDGDGDLDAFVASRRGATGRANYLFQQVAPLRFDNAAPRLGLADPIGPAASFLGSWFDYDADGDVDLLLAVDFWGLELYRNTGRGFARVTAEALPPATDDTPGAPPNNPMSVTWGDFDNDGCIDVFVSGTNMPGQAGFGAETLGDLASRLYRNTCEGRFSDATVG